MSEDCSDLGTRERRTEQNDQEVQYKIITLKALPMLVCMKNTAQGGVSRG